MYSTTHLHGYPTEKNYTKNTNNLHTISTSTIISLSLLPFHRELFQRIKQLSTIYKPSIPNQKNQIKTPLDQAHRTTKPPLHIYQTTNHIFHALTHQQGVRAKKRMQ